MRRTCGTLVHAQLPWREARAARASALTRCVSPARTRDRSSRRLRASAGWLDADALHPARVGVDDFDVEAGRMVQDFAALRQPAGQRHREPGGGVELIFVIGQREAGAELGFQFVNRRAAVGFEAPPARS